MRKYGGVWEEETFWKKMRELDPLGGLQNHTLGSIIPERNRVPEDMRMRVALGDMRVVDLPRLPQQAVAMAGICCVAPEYRRRGLLSDQPHPRFGRALGRRKWQ